MDIEYVRSRFVKHFDGKTGNIYMSPGRINLIGEHTDYNGGFVFPGAVDKGIMAEVRPNGLNTVMLYSQRRLLWRRAPGSGHVLFCRTGELLRLRAERPLR